LLLFAVQFFAPRTRLFAVRGSVCSAGLSDLPCVGIRMTRVAISSAFAFRVAGLVGKERTVTRSRVGVTARPIPIDRSQSAILRC
jgi:hypothetical protein